MRPQIRRRSASRLARTIASAKSQTREPSRRADHVQLVGLHGCGVVRAASRSNRDCREPRVDQKEESEHQPGVRAVFGHRRDEDGEHERHQ